MVTRWLKLADLRNDPVPEERVTITFGSFAWKRRRRAYHVWPRRQRDRMVAMLRQRDGDNCQICGSEMIFDVIERENPRYATLDHVIRPPDGGAPKAASNLRLACLECNNCRHREIPGGKCPIKP